MNEQDKYIGKMLDERYEILEVIGEGGMAVVYKALCHRLNRHVAVKIMRDEMAADEEFRRRFCAESHAVAMLSHPNIVAVYDVSHNDEIEYIVMELINGITLKQYMNRRGAMGWKEVLHFSRQIAKALSHAHERGIVHRDIKPHNIMILRDGTIKVADFGIAALESEVHENSGQTIGSIHYMSPEQARGKSPDVRSDIYSLGVVMYEMLAGKLPYTGDNLADIALAHANAQPENLLDINPDIPAEMERIVMKALNTDIHQRYQSANELLDELDTLVRLPAEEAAPAPVPENVAPLITTNELTKEKYLIRKRRASRVSFFSGTFGLLALCVAVFVFLWNFWIKDVFSQAERVSLPNFVNSYYDTVVSNSDPIYRFNVTYIISNDIEPGLILSQTPEAGRSVMINSGTVDIDLTVSSGVTATVVPDVENYEWNEAFLQLQNAGFIVEKEFSTSATVEKDRVISTSPAAGETINSGSVVYLNVSSGAEILYVQMPNLVGLSEEAAKAKLESFHLEFGGSERVVSALDTGTVVGQSTQAGDTVEEHRKIILQVSMGQEG